MVLDHKLSFSSIEGCSCHPGLSLLLVSPPFSHWKGSYLKYEEEWSSNIRGGEQITLNMSVVTQ